MIKSVRMSYPEFLILKSFHYSSYALKMLACKYLKCSIDDIDDIDFNFKLTFDVYLK